MQIIREPLCILALDDPYPHISIPGLKIWWSRKGNIYLIYKIKQVGKYAIDLKFHLIWTLKMCPSTNKSIMTPNWGLNDWLPLDAVVLKSWNLHYLSNFTCNREIKLTWTINLCIASLINGTYTNKIFNFYFINYVKILIHNMIVGLCRMINRVWIPSY